MTEIVAQISRHINDLINLGKILSIDSNIEEMENKALAWMKKNQSSYWRGADMQVVKWGVSRYTLSSDENGQVHNILCKNLRIPAFG